jgi:hypothetical protein
VSSSVVTAFWYHGGPDFGARYWFLCIIPLIALTGRGVEFMANNTHDTSQSGVNASPHAVLAVGLLAR